MAEAMGKSRKGLLNKKTLEAQVIGKRKGSIDMSRGVYLESDANRGKDI